MTELTYLINGVPKAKLADNPAVHFSILIGELNQLRLFNEFLFYPLLKEMAPKLCLRLESKETLVLAATLYFSQTQSPLHLYVYLYYYMCISIKK